MLFDPEYNVLRFSVPGIQTNIAYNAEDYPFVMAGPNEGGGVWGAPLNAFELSFRIALDHGMPWTITQLPDELFVGTARPPLPMAGQVP